LSGGRTGRGEPARRGSTTAGAKAAGACRRAGLGDACADVDEATDSSPEADVSGSHEVGAVRTAGVGFPTGIAHEIAAEGGMVTLARFIELALTHPTDGCYSRRGAILGPRGHFTTAPCLSPEFNRAVGRLLEELIAAACAASSGPATTAARAASPDLAAAAHSPDPAAPSVVLLELGGGTGELAAAVIQGWEKERPGLRGLAAYVIVEIGEALRAEQKHRLTPLIERGWQVRWASTIDEGIRQAAAWVMPPRPPFETPPLVVVGNEFFDALGVHLVDVRGAEPREAWVALDGLEGMAQGYVPREVWGALSPEAGAELEALFGTSAPAELRPQSRDGFIELRPSAGELLRRLAVHGAGCCLLTIDYGEWFGAGQGSCADLHIAPSQYSRTLRGYFHHQPVADPYVRVGRQDLTADVDFRALDLHGRGAGFETVLFTTVAGLLRANHGDDRLHRLRSRARGSLEADRLASILTKLLDEDDLGGAFKVMLQVKE